MSIRSLFKKAVDGYVRFLENQEIAGLEGAIRVAKQGKTHVVSRGGAIVVDTTPEQAQKIIQTCTERLAEIERKRAARAEAQATPKP